VDKVHIHGNLPGWQPADGQRVGGLIPLEFMAQLLAVHGLEQIQRYLDAVFSYRGALRQWIDLCSLGQRLAVRTKDVRGVGNRELVSLVHGAQLELAPQVGDDCVQREQRSQGCHRVGDGKSPIGAEVEGGDPRFPNG